MSIKLLVDEDSQAKILIMLLKSAGHDVLTVNEAGLSAKDDASVLKYATADNRVLLTRNPADFLILHQVFPDHYGIFTVYQDSNYAKNMSYNDIVKAIENIEQAGIPIVGQFIALNGWKG